MCLSYCEMTVAKIWILDRAEWRKTRGTFWACWTVASQQVCCEWIDVFLRVVFRIGRAQSKGREEGFEGSVREEGSRIVQETPRSSWAAVAHPPSGTPLSPESSSAHRLWEEAQGPSLSCRGCGPAVCQPPSEATLTSQSFVNVSDLGADWAHGPSSCHRRQPRFDRPFCKLGLCAVRQRPCL